MRQLVQRIGVEAVVIAAHNVILIQQYKPAGMHKVRIYRFCGKFINLQFLEGEIVNGVFISCEEPPTVVLCAKPVCIRF